MGETLLRLPDVMGRTGLSRSAVYASEGFPKPVKIGGRAVAWLQSEVEAWIAETIRTNRSESSAA
ncbi:helix-turn-helix transcriptional regulator [Edaphobacter dinghuensis]|uniref:AlpA family phage regulatory protein n=1 Tax=Edaphobacter dinghuensis TaxID=1560005 RepID=A0A917M344_9BACT|nr:AlpA family phage regulatory protein [Edaphobacter dinghuensis]GGG72004.1 AlpA family phage regulatory protein [Edaphobacter dinghuensis]